MNKKQKRALKIAQHVKDQERILAMKIGADKIDPSQIQSSRQRMHGAERRIRTHEVRIKEFREIIKRRAAYRQAANGTPELVHLGEPEVKEYQMKLLKERALLMAAKRDVDRFRVQYEGYVGANAAQLRTYLREQREENYARRFANSHARKTRSLLDAAEGGVRRFITMALDSPRAELRAEVEKVVALADAKLDAVFKRKPKLFTRVIEVLHQELTEMENPGGVQ